MKSSLAFSIFEILFKVVTILVTISIFIFVFYGLKVGLFQDKMVFISYVKHLGFFAPFFFIVLQIFQVVFPVIPGGASCLAGVLSFGPVLGFAYNYIGLTIGSCIGFFLSKRYGIILIDKLFKKRDVQKYIHYIQSSSFSKIFFFCILFPGFPDDLLCYVAGISRMSFREFLMIILVGRPLSLIGYSLFFEFL